MDELEKTLNSVLSDPKQMEQLSRLAGQIFGGGAEAPAETEPPSPAAGDGIAEQLRGLAGAGGLAETLGGLMGGMGPGGKNEKAALLEALLPYLHEERREKLRRAMRLARVARVAGVVLREAGGADGAL